MNAWWKTINISITGARLSHLVQKDKVWDHGSMVEQARIIFYLVQKAKANGNIASLKKQCSVGCFEKLKSEIENADSQKSSLPRNLFIIELAFALESHLIHNRPDKFTALIKGYNRKTGDEKDENADRSDKLYVEWSFVRQGDWWMLDEIK